MYKNTVSSDTQMGIKVFNDDIYILSLSLNFQLYHYFVKYECGVVVLLIRKVIIKIFALVESPGEKSSNFPNSVV